MWKACPTLNTLVSTQLKEWKWLLRIPERSEARAVPTSLSVSVCVLLTHFFAQNGQDFTKSVHPRLDLIFFMDSIGNSLSNDVYHVVGKILCQECGSFEVPEGWDNFKQSLRLRLRLRLRFLYFARQQPSQTIKHHLVFNQLVAAKNSNFPKRTNLT